jgi:hypothetical protein
VPHIDYPEEIEPTPLSGSTREFALRYSRPSKTSHRIDLILRSKAGTVVLSQASATERGFAPSEVTGIAQSLVDAFVREMTVSVGLQLTLEVNER